MTRRPQLASLVTALLLVVIACSSGEGADTVSTSSVAPITTISSTTSAPATTTTTSTTTSTSTSTIPPVHVANTVNGLGEQDVPIERGAVVIKIDNHPSARPQSGLMEADLVYEMLVEGGLTRFAAVFHQSDQEYVGPVRSGRPTDVGVVKPLDAPFQISGAQWWVQDIFKNAGLHVAYETNTSTWRESHRSVPHNLYASSSLLRQEAADRSWPSINPGNVFAFGDPTPGSVPASTIVFEWSDHPDVVWTWNGEGYQRANGDVPHEWVDAEGKGGVVSTPIIVVITGDSHLSSSPDGSGSSVPTTDTFGSGPLHVFIDGQVIEGRWDRESYSEHLHLTTLDGEDLVLPPSRMWVAFFPSDRTLSWS